MKTCKTSPNLLALASLGLLALQPDAHARDASNPVCAPAHHVSVVLGRSAPAVAILHCVVERKVTHGTSAPHVKDIQGRAGATPGRPAADAPAIQANGTGSRAVEWVLGRASGSPVKSPLFTPTVAAPSHQ